jgi:hypothetical protein
MRNTLPKPVVVYLYRVTPCSEIKNSYKVQGNG